MGISNLKITSGILGVFSWVTDSGPPERITPLGFNEDIFSDEIYNFTRIRLAPALILIGFAIQVYAILKSSK